MRKMIVEQQILIIKIRYMHNWSTIEQVPILKIVVGVYKPFGIRPPARNFHRFNNRNFSSENPVKNSKAIYKVSQIT